MRRSRPLLADVMTDMAAVARDGADIVVHMPGLPVHHIAEKLGVPSVVAGLQPVWVPTREFPNPMLPVRLPKALNRATYRAARFAIRGMAKPADTLRATLELPRRRGRHDVFRQPDGTPTTVLHGFSPTLLPADPRYPDFVHTMGFWFLPLAPDWTPSPELSDFLSSGKPPVYIGFGSMAADTDRMTRVIVEALKRTRTRAILASGWGAFDLTDVGDVHLLTEAPHDWLFPKMAGIIHHGGSGTTGAASAAGRPQLIVPFVGDQLFWGARVHAYGAGPAPIRQGDLTADNLASAIVRLLTDDTLATNAARLGDRIRAEPGVTAAVSVLESLT